MSDHSNVRKLTDPKPEQNRLEPHGHVSAKTFSKTNFHFDFGNHPIFEIVQLKFEFHWKTQGNTKIQAYHCNLL